VALVKTFATAGEVLAVIRTLMDFIVGECRVALRDIRG